MYAHFGWTSVPGTGPLNRDRWASSFSRNIRGPSYSLQATPHSLTEHEKFYEFQIDAPGVTPSDIELTVTEKMFELSLHTPGGIPTGFEVGIRERSTLTRSYRGDFRAAVDVNRVEATLTEGVLSIHFAKVPEIEPQKIRIEVSG